MKTFRIKVVVTTPLVFLTLLTGIVTAAPLEERVIALELQVQALLSDVSALQQENANQQTTIDQQQMNIASLQNDLFVVQGSSVFDLAPYVSVDDNEINGVVGPHVIFEGVNFHLRSGSGDTFSFGNGRGNLIIGYNKIGPRYQSGYRSGQHNLVMGDDNYYLHEANGGIVQGEGNTIAAWDSVILAGSENINSSDSGIIVGGYENEANYVWNVVVGGHNNKATNLNSVVCGGENNIASGNYSSVSGGINRQASGDHDWAAGSLWENY